MNNLSSDTESPYQASPSDAPTVSRGLLSGKIRLAISVLIIGHLVAVALPPLAFQAQGPLGQSPSVSLLLTPVRSYGQFLYLNRGYAFFAPDPGPSHLIQVQVTEPDGQITEAMYPDLANQWPRLNYHRHFMLAEFLVENYQPPGPPQQLIDEDSRAAEQWNALRIRYEDIRQSITDHLVHANDGKQVRIRRVEHLIPNFIQFTSEPVKLNDPRFYIPLLDQSFETPAGPPETIPAPLETEEASDGQLTAPVTSGDEATSTTEGSQ